MRNARNHTRKPAALYGRALLVDRPPTRRDVPGGALIHASLCIAAAEFVPSPREQLPGQTVDKSCKTLAEKRILPLPIFCAAPRRGTMSHPPMRRN